MASVQGNGSDPIPISQKDIKMYESEYKHGAQLFQKALKEYEQSTNPYQQEEFHRVMDKAMKVLDETARELNRKNLLEHNEKITKDFAAFSETPQDATTLNTLKGDLDRASKLTG